VTVTDGTFDVTASENVIPGNSGAGIAIVAQNSAIGTFQLLNNIINGTVDDEPNIGPVNQQLAVTPFNGQGIYIGTRSTSTLMPATAVFNNPTISGNTIGDLTNDNLGNPGGGIFVDVIDQSRVDGMTIADNIIARNGRPPNFNPVTIDSFDTTNHGLTFLRRGSAIVDNVLIASNTIQSNLFDGIYLHSYGDNSDLSQLDFTIRDNMIDGNGRISQVPGVTTLLNALQHGIQLRTEADSRIRTTIIGNTIQNNVRDGINLSAFTLDRDVAAQTGVWTQNVIRGNQGHGVVLAVGATLNEDINGNGVLDVSEDTNGNGQLDPGLPPLEIGLSGLDPTNGPSLGNEILNNLQGGIEINGPGAVNITKNTITSNGGNAAPAGIPADLNGTGGIDINLFDGAPGASTTVPFGELRGRIENNIIQSNAGDGVEIRTSSGFISTVTMLGNFVDANSRRGIDILNQGNGITNFRLGDGTLAGGNVISNNEEEGVYIVNTASTTQDQQGAAGTALLADGAVNVAPNMVLDVRNNQISGNNNTGSVAPGVQSIFEGGGLVVRVGTSNSSTVNQSFADPFGNLGGADGSGVGTNSDVSGAITNGLLARAANGRVNARITDNMFNGNLGDDVWLETFRSTVNPVATAGTWAATNDPTQITAFQRDPLARLNLVFRGNTGDSINVTEFQGTFYNNAEDTFKSRLTTASAPFGGPFASATRRRNATRIASRAFPYDDPNVGNVGNFQYDGLGTSTLRVESDFDVSRFTNNLLDFNQRLFLGNPDPEGFAPPLPGELDFQWDTQIPPGTFLFDTNFIFP